MVLSMVYVIIFNVENCVTVGSLMNMIYMLQKYNLYLIVLDKS